MHASTTLPDTNKLTIDEFAKDMSDAAEALLKKGFTTIPALIGHLQADQMIHYIMITVSNETRDSPLSRMFVHTLPWRLKKILDPSIWPVT